MTDAAIEAMIREVIMILDYETYLEFLPHRLEPDRVKEDGSEETVEDLERMVSAVKKHLYRNGLLKED